MKTFLIVIKGYGLGTRIGKLTDEQIRNWDDIQAQTPLQVSALLRKNNTIFDMTCAAADGATIEILDEDEEVYETYEYNQVPFEEVKSFYLRKESKGTYFVDNILLKGTFFRGEITLEEDENFDSNKLTIQLIDYNGELYIDDIMYDEAPIEIINFATTGTQEKARMEVVK